MPVENVHGINFLYDSPGEVKTPQQDVPRKVRRGGKVSPRASE